MLRLNVDNIVEPKTAVDVDARARELMRDLDRARLCSKDDIDSSVLHGSKQRFPTLVLRQQLGIALDQVDNGVVVGLRGLVCANSICSRCMHQLLIGQIRERERAVADMRTEKEEVQALIVDESLSRVTHFSGVGRVNIKDRRRKLAKVH